MKNKKNEFEKLIEYVLADNSISEAERTTLRAKGLQMGIDADEVDIILDAKLHIINKEKARKLNKCNHCGELLDRFAQTCPSCGHATDNSHFINEFDEVEEADNRTGDEIIDTIAKGTADLIEHKDYKLKKYGLVSRFLATAFTGGLYLIYYKKKRRSLRSFLDVNSAEHFIIIDEIDKAHERGKVLFKKNPEMLNALEDIVNTSEQYKKKRILGDITRAISTITILSCFCWLTYSEMSILIERKNKADITRGHVEDINEAITKGNLALAERYYDSLPKNEQNNELLNKIIIARMDSLVASNDYAAAIEQANLLPDNSTSNTVTTRTYNIDKLLPLHVEMLIGQKRFTDAEAYLSLMADGAEYQQLKNLLESGRRLQKTKKH